MRLRELRELVLQTNYKGFKKAVETTMSLLDRVVARVALKQSCYFVSKVSLKSCVSNQRGARRGLGKC